MSSAIYFVDIIRQRKPIGSTRYEARSRRLFEKASLDDGGTNSTCDHREPLAAFAYLRERNEHWPILLCDACGQITAGRVPKPPRRTGPDFDERDVIVARWRERWPRSGRPRTNEVPADTVWVEDLLEDGLLRCVECGRVSDSEAQGWASYLDEDDEARTFCPDCSEREFGV